MKKLYYTCPIEAAYMAKNFGVELYAAHSDDQMSEYDLSEEQRNFDWFDSSSCEGSEEVYMVSEAVQFMENVSERIYVHPESLSIFDPQLNDYVEYGMHDCCYVGEMPTRVDRLTYSKGHGPEGYKEYFYPQIRYIRKIVQRDGKPFLWPLEETNPGESK